uniref:Protoporphyrinogen oxidase n=1 Tax=Bracon brevicornis TaxID=1563983 RepID=A0A6V7HSA6_9HYME
MTAILGGGLSGLSAAYYALENPRLSPLTLYEASNRLGGWVRTVKSKNGVTFEKGPRTIRPSGLAGQNTLKLIDDLKLSSDILPIPSDHPAARNRMLYANGDLHLLPNSFRGLFKTNPPFKRPLITILKNDLFSKRVIKDDESMYSFVERKFGTDVADYLISPMLCGICAGDAKQISVKFLLKHLFKIEQQHRFVVGGIVKDMLDKNLAALLPTTEEDSKKLRRELDEGHNDGIGVVMEVEGESLSPSVKRSQDEKWSVWSMREGLEKIPNTLKKQIEANNVKLSINTEIQNIIFKENSIEMETNNGVERAERIISCLSSQKLGKIIESQHPELARELMGIPLVNVGVVNFEFPGKILPIEAFGFLVPPKEKIPILGVIFDSCVIPREDKTVRLMDIYGRWLIGFCT